MPPMPASPAPVYPISPLMQCKHPLARPEHLSLTLHRVCHYPGLSLVTRSAYWALIGQSVTIIASLAEDCHRPKFSNCHNVTFLLLSLLIGQRAQFLASDWLKSIQKGHIPCYPPADHRRSGVEEEGFSPVLSPVSWHLPTDSDPIMGDQPEIWKAVAMADHFDKMQKLKDPVAGVPNFRRVPGYKVRKNGSEKSIIKSCVSGSISISLL